MSDHMQVVIRRVATVVGLAGFANASDAAANDAAAQDDAKTCEQFEHRNSILKQDMNIVG